MSDRRAVTAGHLAASSVAAASEPWRVAIGGNRVQNMSVEQIAQAYRAGQLTARTPLWPPGTSGWQALGNFEQFQAAAAAPEAAYNQLSQFEETDDAPTRMWTGSADLSELEGAMLEGGRLEGGRLEGAGFEGGRPMPLPEPEPAQVAPQRPPSRTGTRQVASRPRPVAAATQPARMTSTAPGLAATRASAPTRSSGLWLVAGLVGLVGLGSAVLAARGSWSAAAPAPDSASTPSAETKHAATPASPAPSGAATGLAKYEDTQPAAEAVTARAEPAPAAAAPTPAPAPAAAAVEAPKSPAPEAPAAEAPASEARPLPDTTAPEAVSPQLTASQRRAARAHAEGSARAAASKRAARREREREQASEPASEPKPRSTALPVTKQRETPALAEAPKTKPAKPEAKAETQAASSSMNDAAASALANAAKLAASCRPRGGPAGAGKARVIYSGDGEVQSVEILTAKFRDTLTGSCVRMVFRRAKIPAFRGEPPTFIKSFTIPEE